ncbi:hypothetical protein [Nitrosophilus labii]|uniref:hypothetical protein n=1 Tax=Nitrosophilus labii TaxID=2706014 RepID=UPI001657159F|nr:hypothetical protein [Nitrosophilus labii]
MKKQIALYITMLSTTLYADIYDITIEANDKMTWNEAKRFCANKGMILPSKDIIKGLNDKELVVFDSGRYWIDYIADWGEERGAYGRNYAIPFITLPKDNKLKAICFPKNYEK